MRREDIVKVIVVIKFGNIQSCLAFNCLFYWPVLYTYNHITQYRHFIARSFFVW